MEESLSKFMDESIKIHDENSNLIKEIQTSTDAAIRNQGASIKALEIQIGQMRKVMDAPTIPVSVDSSKGNFRDAIYIGIPIEEEMSTLRFRIGIAEAENASLRGKIRTMEAIETVTHSQERRTHREMERQLASVQESQRQDRENFRKLQELVTSQLGRHL
ncbi:hypothetical protein Tco_0369378 [Tanacetum coccineum]